jgi:hypothetical protein
MFKTDEIEAIYERMLLNEYSESFIKKEVIRLRRQADPLVTDDVIKQTIVRFDQLKTGRESGNRIKEIVSSIQPDVQARDQQRDKQRVERLKNSPFDVTLYSWKDLEHVVHQFSDPAERRAMKELAKGGATEQTRAELVYDKDSLKIYWGKNKKDCIAFGTYLNKKNEQGFKDIQDEIKAKTSRQPGQIYYWCIGWVNNNQFDNYRFATGGRGASVYYVVDESLPLNDSHHVIVIHAQQDNRYRLTNAFNNNETVSDWNTVLKWQPKLNGLQDIIKFHPFTEEEEIGNMVKYATAKDFHALVSFRAKEAYINSGKMLLSKDYLELDPKLQHLYVNVICGPDVADRSIQARLNKTLYLFTDSRSIPGNHERIQQARLQMIEILENMSDEDYTAGNRGMEPYYEDPIMIQSKGQTYKLWKKFTHDVVNAWINGAVELRGYAQ